MNTNEPNEGNLSRDLHVRYRPSHVEELWNFPREPALQCLIQNMQDERLSTVVILTGPYGSGKTTLATYLGQWTSCQRWKDNALPCGECGACKTVRFAQDNLRCGFFEIDCGWDGNDGVAERMVGGFNEFLLSCKGNIYDAFGVPTNNPHPRVLFLDEVQRLSGRVQDMLLKRVEKLPNGIVVLATTDLAKIDGGLRSRGTIYSLSYPTPEEAVPHLIRIAAAEKFTLQLEAAQAIAQSGYGMPRECLGVLQKTMSPKRTVITLKEVDAVLPPSDADKRER